MTPEREAQMREMFRKFTADQTNRRAIENLAYRQDVALFVWLACARALEPMVRDGELLEKLRQKLECDGFGYWLPEICLKEIPPDVEGVGTPPTQEEFREALDAAMSAATTCVACEGSPSAENNPCAVCGRAATVGEAKMPDTSDDPVNLLHRVLTIAGFSSEDAEYQKLTDALIGAAQQQAEPGADERAAFEAVWARIFGQRVQVPGYDMFKRDEAGEYVETTVRDDWCMWQVRAAQSGQRAGVAELPRYTFNRYAESPLERDDSEGEWVKLEDVEAMLAAAPTQQQEGDQ